MRMSFDLWWYNSVSLIIMDPDPANNFWQSYAGAILAFVLRVQ